MGTKNRRNLRWRTLSFSFVLACCASSAWPRTASAQVQCPPVTVGPITQTADLALKTENGSCTIDASSSNGGYVKASTTYRMHITAAVTGRCQSRIPSGGVCTDGASYTRTIGTTWQYVDYPTFVGSVVVNPSNTTTIQNYSTIGSVNTLNSGASWGSSVEGPHVYTTTTNANASHATSHGVIPAKPSADH
jgi:hypothetical protein